VQWWQTQHRPFPTTRTPDLASPGIRRCSRRSRVGRPLRIPDRSGPTACPSPGPAHHAGLKRGATPLGGLSRSSASVNLGCRTAPSLSAQRPGRFPCRTDAGHRPGGMRRSARADAPRVARPVCSSALPGTQVVPRTSPLAPLGLDSGVYRSPLSRPSLNGQPNTSLLPSCSLSHPTCLVSHTGRGGMSPAIGRGAPDQTMAAGALISGTAHQREGLGLCAEAPAGAASTGTGKPPEGAARGPS